MTGAPAATAGALIWIAHIGFDRGARLRPEIRVGLWRPASRAHRPLVKSQRLRPAAVALTLTATERRSRAAPCNGAASQCRPGVRDACRMRIPSQARHPECARGQVCFRGRDVAVADSTYRAMAPLNALKSRPLGETCRRMIRTIWVFGLPKRGSVHVSRPVRSEPRGENSDRLRD